MRQARRLSKLDHGRYRAPMLVGTTSSSGLKAPDGYSPIGCLASASVDTLLLDFAVGRCDVVVLPADCRQPSITAGFSAVCLTRPAAVVWATDRGAAGVAILASGRYGPSAEPPGRKTSVSLSLEALRLTWVHAWARWVGAAAQQAQGAAIVRELPAECFLRALQAAKAPDLACGIGLTQRQLQQRLARLGLAGPKRFLMSARMFLAWECARARPWTLEQIACRIGFASLSSMNHCFASMTGLPTRELVRLADFELVGKMAEALGHPAQDQQSQASA